VRPKRLRKSVQKLRQALDQRGRPALAQDSGLDAVAGQLRQLLATLQGGAMSVAPLRQLQVSPAGAGMGTIRMVPMDDVLYLQAADKYVRVVTASGEHLLRTPLKDLLPRLDARQFRQIHRSTLVRADAIDTVQRDEAGKLHLRLHGSPDRLTVSRLYAHLFKAM
ncbi:MAG: LytTR family transcriptional regulator, partial [Burkholderiaceae bacterium]|jgi:DNA-binding LytR/AlgR family response regulator|nr:LytTR family transcriptional regulator [Burkholderiaceae bacterium]